MSDEAEQLRSGPSRRTTPASSAISRIGAGGEGRGRAWARRRRAGRAGEDQGEEGRRERRPRARSRAPAGSCIAGRILGPAEAACQRPVRGAPIPSRSQTRRPNVPTRHLEARLRRPGARDPATLWRERRTFARLRAQNAGGPRWSFLDGPITANNPMGVHHAWGRAYKDLYQRFHAMLGEDQRYQNGFDCQGLWVEVNVERDLGFTTKRDIEAYGIAEFVTPVQAARPDLRRAPDRAVDPARDVDGLERPGRAAPAARPARRRTRPRSRRSRARTARSPTPSRCSSGGSGCPTSAARTSRSATRTTTSSGASSPSATGAAGCTRATTRCRGAPRCGTGLSQMEMNEGYQDREDPGPDRPLPAARPAGRGAARLDDDALDADRERRGGGRRRRCATSGSARARTQFWLGKGTLQDGRSRARSRSLEERRRRRPGRLALRGPVRRAAGGPDGLRGRHARRARPRRTSTASCRGARSARTRGPASSTSRPAAAPRTSSSARRSACRSSRRSTRRAIIVDGLRLADRAATSATSPSRSSSTSSARAASTASRPYTHRYPHCWRCGTPLLFRLVDEWFISMGPLYDQPRETLTTEQVDASLRYQIMDVVDQIRWIPDFGYERELDWLRNMHDWMISKKRYWGLALPIYDCAACGTVEVIGGRDELQERAVEGWDGVRGPHAAPAVRRRGQDRLPRLRRAGRADQGRRQPVARRRDRAVLDAPLPRGPGVLGAVVPGRLHHRELPGPVPQLVLLDARDVDGPPARAAVQDDLRLRPRLRRGRPPDAQELGQRDRVRRGGRADGRRRHALDVRQGAARGEHPVRLARGRRGAPRAARPVERLRVLRDLRAAGRLDARPRRRRRRRRPAGARPLDPVPGGRARRPRSRTGCATYDAVGATRALSRVHRRPVDLVPAPVAAAVLAIGRRRRTEDAAFATLHEALVGHDPDARADPAVPGRGDVPEPRRRRSTRTRPTAST